MIPNLLLRGMETALYFSTSGLLDWYSVLAGILQVLLPWIGASLVMFEWIIYCFAFKWSSSIVCIKLLHTCQFDLPDMDGGSCGARCLQPSASWYCVLLVWCVLLLTLPLTLCFFVYYSTCLPLFCFVFFAVKCIPKEMFAYVCKQNWTVCLKSSQQSIRLRWYSTDALFTDLCFGFCPPLLLSPFPASFFPSSAPPSHIYFLSMWPSILYCRTLLLTNHLHLPWIILPPFSLFTLHFSHSDLKPIWFCHFDPPPLRNSHSPMAFIFAPPLTIMETTTPRPTLGGLISTFVSPLPPPLLLLFLSSALRSLSLKMVTPQSLFTLFGMFNLYYSICISLSVNQVLFTFFSDVVDFCIFLYFQAFLYYIVYSRVQIYFCHHIKSAVSLTDCPFGQLISKLKTPKPLTYIPYNA